MKNAVKSGLWQGLGPRFMAAALATAAMLGFSLVRDILSLIRQAGLLPSGFHRELLVYALTSDTFAPALPLLAALPFSGCYVDDIKSKFARFFLLRSGYGGYLGSRFLTCFLLGGSVVALGALLGWGALALLLTPMERAGENGKLLFQAVQAICLSALSGGFWAVVGMTMSTFMESKYIAYVSPFVTYYLLIILCERYFVDAVLFYPRQWLSPSEGWPFGAWAAAVLLTELTALMALIFYFRGKRRLMEL